MLIYPHAPGADTEDIALPRFPGKYAPLFATSTALLLRGFQKCLMLSLDKKWFKDVVSSLRQSLQVDRNVIHRILHL